MGTCTAVFELSLSHSWVSSQAWSGLILFISVGYLLLRLPAFQVSFSWKTHCPESILSLYLSLCARLRVLDFFRNIFFLSFWQDLKTQAWCIGFRQRYILRPQLLFRLLLHNLPHLTSQVSFPTTQYTMPTTQESMPIATDVFRSIRGKVSFNASAHARAGDRDTSPRTPSSLSGYRIHPGFWMLLLAGTSQLTFTLQNLKKAQTNETSFWRDIMVQARSCLFTRATTNWDLYRLQVHAMIQRALGHNWDWSCAKYHVLLVR